MEAKIQFIKGLDEKVLPDVRLTRSIEMEVLEQLHSDLKILIF
jgi:hypothetical protein